MKYGVVDGQATIAAANSLLVAVNGKVRGKCMTTGNKNRFPFVYRYPDRDEDMLAINDVLQQTTYKDYPLEELLAKVKDPNNLDIVCWVVH